MGLEIERKFLVIAQDWQGMADGVSIRQGYLPTERHTVVRIRLNDTRAFLAVKGKNNGISRMEFEYEIPGADAEVMLESLCRHPLIEKTRYRVGYGGMTWEIDVFDGANKGLVVAEIELEYEAQQFSLPPWVTTEVTGDPRYYNANLVRQPYCEWPDR